jgi:hypothetical protein
LAERDGESVGGGGADQGRAAYLHGADGVRRFGQRGNADPVQRMRQSGLINDVDDPFVGMGAQGACRDAVDVHGRVSVKKPIVLDDGAVSALGAPPFYLVRITLLPHDSRSIQRRP